MSILPSGVVSDRGGDFALVLSGRQKSPHINVADGKRETYFRRRKGLNPAPIEGPVTARAVLEKRWPPIATHRATRTSGSVRLSDAARHRKEPGSQGRTLRLFGRLRASQ